METIYTLGYSGSSHNDLKGYVDLLNAALIDIRYQPWSRVPEWRQDALRALLGERYYYSKDLGNINYNNGGAIQLSNPEAGAEFVAPLLAKQPAILLCMCPNWETCHRATAAGYLSVALGAEVIHLPGRFQQFNQPRLI